MKLKDDDFWKPLIAPIEVIEGKEPILQVTYDEEGDWMSFGESDSDDCDCLSLEEALALDASLTSLPDLQRGQSAWRETVGDEWQVE